MSSLFGVTPEGFKQKTAQDIKTEIEDDLRARFGAGINLLATSVFGQLVGVETGRQAELWEVAAAVYRAMYPDSASAEALDNVASITGTLRLGAAKSAADAVILTGTSAAVLPVGRVLSVVGAGDRFASTTPAVLAAATARAPTTPYFVGDVRTNAGNIYVVTIAGTSGAGGGPTGTGSAIVDGTVTWRFVGTGTFTALADFESEEFGEINAPAFTLTVIETPVSGWTGAGNRLDAELGREIESDADFRVRREQLLRASGSATLEAIRARVREVEGVTQVFIFENTSLVTDSEGVPGKAFETVVQGGVDQAIADMIFLHKPVGIEAHGTEVESVVDTQGFAHTIKFSRPTEIDMWIDVTVKVNPATFPADGVDQVKAALVAVGDALQIGDDVIILSFRCAPLDQVAGVIDVPVIEIEDTPSPTNTANIVIAVRDLAVFDTSRINVTVTT